MRRLVLGVAVAVTACKPIEVGQGRYACDPAGNREVGSAQCPGNSRCGLEKVCHDVGDTSVRWVCETADDCEGGWMCGVAASGETRECHDPNAPEDFRCHTSADCAGGWRCGLDSARQRRCHDPSKPEAWPCDSTDDCVGGWQCGLNDFRTGRECHDPAMPRTFACATDADCLGGWQCGLTDARNGRECHDPAAPRAFACEAPSDCLGGWQCGLNNARNGRECHDPANPRDFACEVGTDCLGGWVCGLNDARSARECHDPQRPREFACQGDGDCVASWKCGLTMNRLQRECHDPNAPQAWACDGDADCLGGWRCGLDRRCINPLGDALVSVAPRDAGPGSVASPIDTTPVTRLAVSPLFKTPSGRDITVLAMVRGGRLTAVARESGAFRQWNTTIAPDGQLLSAGSRWIRDLSSFPGQVRVNTPMVYAVLDGGVLAVELLDDGGVASSAVEDPTAFNAWTPISELRHGVSFEFTDGGAPNGADMPYMLGFSPANPQFYLAFDGPGRGDVRNLYRLPAVSSPTTVVFDLADIYYPRPGASGSTTDLECTFMVDSSGLWVDEDDSRFEPIHTAAFGNAACGATGLRVERFATIDQTRAIVVASPWDGGTRTISAWDLSPMLPQPGQNPTGFWCMHDWTFSTNTCRPFDRGMPNVVIGPCAACQAGELLGASAVSAPGQPLELETRCGAADGGAFAFFRVTATPGQSGACTSRLVASTSSLFFQPSLLTTDQHAAGRLAFASPSGQVWTGANALSASSLHFDAAARGVLRVGGGELVAVGEGVVGLFVDGFGLAGVSRASPTAVGVNEPSWAVQDNQVLSFSRASSINSPVPLAVSGASLGARQVLVRATSPANESVAVLAAGNQLWTAVVDDTTVPAPPPALLAARVTTLGDISSLAVTATPDAGTTFVGYATTPFGVSRLTATSATSWRSDDVPLPPGLTPREVWFSGGRARVGFTTGEVYSLPSRVPIAPALPEPAEDFIDACGRQLALTRSGLFELEAVAASPIGVWSPVALPARSSFTDGRLFVVGDELFVFTRAGELTRLSLAPCQ